MCLDTWVPWCRGAVVPGLPRYVDRCCWGKKSGWLLCFENYSPDALNPLEQRGRSPPLGDDR